MVGMCVNGTPVRFYPELGNLGLYVKHEERSNPDGPRFSKSRGVFAHVKKQRARVIGVLDTSHSRGGWAVAQACKLLGKRCRVYYPVRKHGSPIPGPLQAAAGALDAELCPLPAARSAILYHRARKGLPAGAYMMPNALKLPESVAETAAEVARTDIPSRVKTMLISASSGTIAAGVIRGLAAQEWDGRIIVHMGYSRSEPAVLKYLATMAELNPAALENVSIVDEGYVYSDKARDGVDVVFPCDPFYDLKALRWWCASKRRSKAMLWNIG